MTLDVAAARSVVRFEALRVEELRREASRVVVVHAEEAAASAAPLYESDFPAWALRDAAAENRSVRAARISAVLSAEPAPASVVRPYLFRSLARVALAVPV